MNSRVIEVSELTVGHQKHYGCPSDILADETDNLDFVVHCTTYSSISCQPLSQSRYHIVLKRYS